jgi:glycosyltransferase involved in cell wall biosynthesis
VLSAGRLERYKHVDQTIRAVEVLGSEFNLTITGDGPDRGRLQHLVDELGLHDRVRFVGRVDEPELHALYRRADVYVSMSTNEAMPVTILELLACGARVVASDIPAHRDIAARTNGEIAIIPTDARPAELAEAIAESAHLNPRKAEVPTWDEVADATRALYVELVNPHG